MRVLLTSSRAPVTLDLARRFKAQGHQVVLCDSLRFGCATLSRFYDKKRMVPQPCQNPRVYVDALEAIVQSEKIDLLIPTCEEVFFISAFRDQLSCPVLIDSIDKLQQIHNKWTFAQSATCGSTEIPETHLIESEEQAMEFRERSTEFVFKPVYSRFATEALIVPSPELLESKKLGAKKPWVAQRFIEGQEYSTYSIAREGKLLAHASYTSLYKAGLGSGIYLQNTPHAPLLEFVQRFVADIDYTGQIGFDAILDKNGKTWVIEGNPRATSGLHLFEDHTPFVETMLGLREELLIANGSRCMIGFAMPFWGLAQAIRNRRLSRYFNDIWCARDVLFRWNDPLPAWGIFLPLSELLWISWRRQKTLQQASTFDLEWNGQPL